MIDALDREIAQRGAELDAAVHDQGHLRTMLQGLLVQRWERQAAARAVREASFVTVARAAVQLGVGPSTVTRWIRTGKLAARRYPSGRYRIPVEDIEHLLEFPKD